MSEERRQAAQGIGVGPILLFLTGLACTCGGGGGGSCSVGPGGWWWDVVPTPTPYLGDGPDGGRLYVLLTSTSGAAVEVIQVETSATTAVLPLTVSTATALAFAERPDALLVGDAERSAVAVIGLDGTELELLPTIGKPADIAFAGGLDRIFVATTAGLLVYRDGAIVDGILTGGERGTAVAVREHVETLYYEDEDGQLIGSERWVQTRAALAVVGTAGAAVHIAYLDTYVDPEDPYSEREYLAYYFERHPLAGEACTPGADAVDIEGSTEHARVFVGDSGCERIHVFEDGFGPPIVISSAGTMAANGVAWSVDRDALFVAHGALLELDLPRGIVAGIPGVTAPTSLATSIDGQTVWAGSDATGSGASPSLHRWDGALSSTPVGLPGARIEAIEHRDRPPFFPEYNPFFGALAAAAKREQIGAFRVEAIDPDGDTVEIEVEGFLPDGIAFSELTHEFTWILGCDVEPGAIFTIRVLAISSRWRSPIDFFLFVDAPEEGEPDPCE